MKPTGEIRRSKMHRIARERRHFRKKARSWHYKAMAFRRMQRSGEW